MTDTLLLLEFGTYARTAHGLPLGVDARKAACLLQTSTANEDAMFAEKHSIGSVDCGS
jgi:hypothetical protein